MTVVAMPIDHMPILDNYASESAFYHRGADRRQNDLDLKSVFKSVFLNSKDPLTDLRNEAFEFELEALEEGLKDSVQSFIDLNRFLNLMPKRIDIPMVGMAEDGIFVLDWRDEAKKSALAVSFQGKGEVIFAAILNDGLKRIRGTEIMGNEFPSEIGMLLEKNFSKNAKEGC